MPRGAIAGPGAPFVRVYKVLDGNRIRLSREEVEGLVPWLAGQTVERVGLPGPRGGVVLLDSEAVAEALAALDPASLTEATASTERGDFARFLGMRWPIVFSFEPLGKGNRYSVTLPEGARRMGLLPGLDEEVVVFLSGSIFEIWDKSQWLEYVRSHIQIIGAVLRASKE